MNFKIQNLIYKSKKKKIYQSLLSNLKRDKIDNMRASSFHHHVLAQDSSHEQSMQCFSTSWYPNNLKDYTSAQSQIRQFSRCDIILNIKIFVWMHFLTFYLPELALSMGNGD